MDLQKTQRVLLGTAEGGMLNLGEKRFGSRRRRAMGSRTGHYVYLCKSITGKGIGHGCYWPQGKKPEGYRWSLSVMLNSPTATLGWKSLLIGVVRSLSPEVCKQHLSQWFSMWVILPLGTFGNVWSHFLLLQVGGGMLTLSGERPERIGSMHRTKVSWPMWQECQDPETLAGYHLLEHS